jgi:hypothetical protein
MGIIQLIKPWLPGKNERTKQYSAISQSITLISLITFFERAEPYGAFW